MGGVMGTISEAHPPLAVNFMFGDRGSISGRGRWFYVTQEPARWKPLHQ
jgi:hypothetical protein